jgi:phosphinothricin acetyltransferase
VLRPVHPNDAAAIVAIYTPFVEQTAISFELIPPTVPQMRQRISELTEKYPWYVWEEAGRVVGYAYAGPYRTREAYQWNAEVSVYVDPGFNRRGIARALYAQLITELERTGFINLYAVIALPNDPSVKLHEACGFEYFATYKNVGFKLNRWHDVGWWVRSVKDLPQRPKAQKPAPKISSL